MLAQKFPGGGGFNYLRNAYDLAGNLVQSRDELGQITTFAYDGLSRAVTNTLPDGAVITFGYNAAGSITNRTMPGDLVWSATYDNANHLLTEKRSHAGTTSITNAFKYYPPGPFAGLVQVITDGRGVVRTNSYDSLLRLAKADYRGPLAEHTNHLVFTYDRRGLLTQLDSRPDNLAITPPVTLIREYDSYNSLTNEQVQINGITETHLTQGWDAAGRRTSLARGAAVPVQGTGAGSTLGYAYRADGLPTSVTANGQNYNFAYDTTGLLNSSSNPFRNLTVNQRDGRGRLKQQTLTVGAATPLVEAFNWRLNSTLDDYTATRSTFTDFQDYSYNLRGQLTNDTLKPSASVAAVNTAYTFDSTKLGVLIGAAQSGGLANSWKSGPLDNLYRVISETNSVAQLAVRANGLSGAESLSATLDGNSVGITYPADSDGRWYSDLAINPGSHTLSITSQNPSGVTNSAFTLVAPENITDSYDAYGNLTNRAFADGRNQVLSWDAVGRLVKVVEKNGATTNYIWTAIYDGLGRRVRTVHNPGGNFANLLTIDSWFDPQVEFLEIAVEVAGSRTWKVYGSSGLEATIRETDGATIGLLNDYYGNGIATISGTTVNWNPARVNGYGPLRGIAVPTLSLSVPLAEATAWRGQRIDPTGLYWLGARHYDPVAGRFISPDPLGHAASMDLYSAFNGDPVNYFDADGRCGKAQTSLGANIYTITDINSAQKSDTYTPFYFFQGEIPTPRPEDIIKPDPYWEELNRAAQQWGNPNLQFATPYPDGNLGGLPYISPIDVMLRQEESFGDALFEVLPMLPEIMIDGAWDAATSPITGTAKVLTYGVESAQGYSWDSPYRQVSWQEAVGGAIDVGLTLAPELKGGAFLRGADDIGFSAWRSVGEVRPIPLYDVGAPWYRYTTPSFGVEASVVTEGRTLSEITATKIHEGQHIGDVFSYPQLTHLATQRGVGTKQGYFPGSGLARYWFEYRGYNAAGQLTSPLTPFGSFNGSQMLDFRRDALIFGGGTGGAIYMNSGD